MKFLAEIVQQPAVVFLSGLIVGVLLGLFIDWAVGGPRRS
jgi:F0F1-type ATP synthase assembly protein I